MTKADLAICMAEAEAIAVMSSATIDLLNKHIEAVIEGLHEVGADGEVSVFLGEAQYRLMKAQNALDIALHRAEIEIHALNETLDKMEEGA